MLRALALAALLGLGTCQAGKAPDAPLTGPARVEADRKACEKRGGNFAPGGRSQALYCFVVPKDAGRQCTKSTQCSSACLAFGTCAPVAPLLGCHEIRNAAGVIVTQCID
ncbi:MAG: hypothetical protein N2422_12090 [Rhodobacteraceae bacterium]|nr:hypothetical protein [Paracoccaceae bacterium]